LHLRSMFSIRLIALFALSTSLLSVDAIQGNIAVDAKGRLAKPSVADELGNAKENPRETKERQDNALARAQAAATKDTVAEKAPPMGVAGVFGSAFGGTVIFGLLVMGFIVWQRPEKPEHGDSHGMHHGGWQGGGEQKGKGKFHGMHPEGEHKGKGEGKFHGMHPEGEQKGKGKFHGMHPEGEQQGMQPGKGVQHSGKPGFGGKKGKPGVGAAMGGKQGQQPIAQAAAPVAQVPAPAPAPAQAAPAAPAAPAPAAAAPAQATVAELPPGAPRAPELNTKMALIVDVKNGIDMPNVNTFGGCDPFVEIRIVKGDPSKKGGDVEAIPKDTVRTKAKDGDTTPDWNETLRLAKATYAEDTFVNIILWDSNITKNTPIGYQHLPITELLSDMTYDASVVDLPKKDFVAASFQSLLADKSMGLKASVNMAFSYLEVHKFTFNIKSGSRLPKVDTLGSIDAFIEVRLVKGDPKTFHFERSPGAETLWSAKTNTVNDSMDPEWNQELSVTAPAEPGNFFVFALIDAGHMANTPVGMVTVPLQGLCGQRNGEVEFNSNLKKFANWDAPEGLTKAKLKFKLSHYIATGA